MRIHIQAPPRHAILVVEDSNLVRGILKEEFEAEGFAVHLAEDGERGLEMARALRPDVVLLDVGLPSLDGYEVCRRIKADLDLGDTPVIMVSSANELEDKLAGFEAGADDYVSKPFFTKELLARVRTSLRQRDSLLSSRRLGQSYLEALFGIGSAITSPFNVDDELDVILRQALRAAACRRGSILLLEHERGTLEVRATSGYEEGGGSRVGERFRVGDKIPLHTAEGPAGIGSYEDRDRGTAFVPMVAKERFVGGIELEFGGDRLRLNANVQKVLYALASQAAIFIENARLERDVRSMFLNIIVSLAGAVDARDAYTHGHSLRVARVALIVGHELGLTREQMEPLLLAAILHDVGKIAIPDHILKKAERLDREEFEIMKSHAATGARMLQHIDALSEVIPGILHHHEFWNGRGYPHALEGAAIPLVGRIIHIGDAFDAMTTDRVYRRKVSAERAMAEIERHAGSQFDPQLVDLASRALREGRLDGALVDSTPTMAELIERIR